MIQIGAVFITYDKKLLMIHRDDIPNIVDPGKWSIIGGHIEEGETIEEGMRRECKEECNVNPKNLKYLGWLDHKDVRIYAFTAKLEPEETGQIKLGNEGQEIKFTDFGTIKKLPLAKILTYYMKHYPEGTRKLVEGEKVTAEELGLS